MQHVKYIFFALIAIVLTGCAHPIVISPDISKIERDSNVQVIPNNVGYYLLDDREKEVITAGGGGDKVRYKPYKDIETGFYKMLANVFKSVTALKSDKDEAISKSGIRYIISLDVSTNSSSPSLFTWPPTTFGVNLNCDIRDATGNNVMHLLSVGEGHAEFDEFKSDFSLAAKRASQDALLKMQHSLLNAPELTGQIARVGTPMPQTPQNDLHATAMALPKSMPNQNIDAADKLRDLNALYKDGVISKKDFDAKKKEILDSM